MKTMIENKWSIATLLTIALICYFVFGSAESAMLIAPAAAVTLDDLPALAAEFKTRADELKGIGEELKTKTENGEKIGKELKETVDGQIESINTLKTSIAELEQKMARGEKETPEQAKSWGEQVIESDQYKAWGERGFQGSIKVETKQVTSAAAGGLIVSRRETDVVNLPRERTIIRDLLPVIPIDTSSVDYPKQLSRTNAAAPVGEGLVKPYSDFAWTQASAPVRTIAHLAKLTRQAMDDARRLVGEVDSEMRYGLGLVEEAQILNGNGTGNNLNGILPQAAAYAAPTGSPADVTRVDVLRLAMLQAALGLYPADGIVLNVADWAFIELSKTTDGAYLFANPQGQVDARLWGLRVVPTAAMAQDNFLVGAFRFGATLYDRMGVEVLISTENADDFEKNLATMRAEERIALAVKRPNAFITGDFTTATAVAP